MQLFKAIKNALVGIWQAQKASLAEPLKIKQAHHDYALMLVALGDLLGYPFQSTLYSRTLLAYWIHHIKPWRERLLKERDILDKISE